MKVLLLQSVPKVGKKDEVVEVADGYAQHSLFPKKLAIPATPAALSARDTRLTQLRQEMQVRHKLLDAAIAQLAGEVLTLEMRANEQGNLFSKLHPKDIVGALEKRHIYIDESHISIPEIKKRGEYSVSVVDGAYKSQFTVSIV